jgi:hypothetical protein
MVQLSQPGWMRTLSEVEQAIQGCLNSLDRYEQAFGKAYAEVKDAQPRPTGEDPRLQSLEKVWVERLAKAQHAADEVEVLLNEQQTLWKHWLDSYNHWKASLANLPGGTPEGNHAEDRRDPARRRKVGAIR